MLKRLPLSFKLALIGLIPLLFLFFLAIQVYNQKMEKITVLDTYLQRINQSVHIATLINDLQTERRYSFGYVLQHNWRTELVLQRPKTDASLTRLQNDSSYRLTHITSYTFLDSLNTVRAHIDNGKLQALEVMNYYTNAIFRLNTLNNVSAGNIVYLQEVNKDLIGQKLLSEIITYLGILRSQIYYGLYKKQEHVAIVSQLKSVNDILTTYEREFDIKASPEAIRQFHQLKSSGDLGATLSYINELVNLNDINNRYDPEEWWTLSASSLDQIKNLQGNLLNKVQQSLVTIYNREVKNKDTTLVVLILLLTLVIFLVGFTIISISRSLKELQKAAQQMATGSTDLSIPVYADDAIGKLAQSITKISNSNKVLSEAATAIGNGQFDIEVQPRSAEDVLGNAIVSMKNNLQRYTKENEEKIWVQTGIAQITESLQGVKDLHTLCTEALHTLIKHIGGSLGFFYVDMGHRQLEFIGGYAIPTAASFPQKVKYGETLVGQSAQSGELVQLSAVPDDYIRINSGSGEAKAQHIIIVPLIHNQQVEGVIEIASFKPFTTGAVALLQQVNNNIAIALQSNKSRMKLRELLEQTQNQAEELQAQHEEMEHLNSELEAHTQRLQASEEELRVQQEELQQANQELEERTRLLEEKNNLIIERNAEISHKAEELILSNKYKSEFLANMSHELRTPLNSILLLSRLMAENNDKNLSADQVEYAKVIQSSGKGLLSLIDEILDLSKIEAGKMELEYASLPIEEIVDDLEKLFEPIAKDKGLQFDIITDKALPPFIDTDKMRLEQVLKNLIANALKFTSKGSVTVHISPTEKADHIQFAVKDTGIGISPEKQQSIFEAFQQADGSTRRKYGGTGLGLSISRELTRLLGGTIQLKSEPGNGSEFSIIIPTHKPTAITTEPDVTTIKPVTITKLFSPTTEAGNTNHLIPSYTTADIPEAIPDDRHTINPGDKIILIVEDDTAFAKALLDFTQKQGYKGIVAVRGDEGIVLAKQFKPTGILLDIQLPVKNGWEVMDDLKKDSQTRHIPVHIMSSHQLKKESLLKGAVDFINKPVAFEQLPDIFKKIELVLTRHPKKVLIVEENNRHAQALAYFLESNKVVSEIKSSLQDGIKALTKDEVDCVILDMGIPDQKAYNMLELVKKSPGFENLPIIIFTGKSLSQTEEQRIKQYADSIVVKTAHSYQRIMDEVTLFLHLVNEQQDATNGDKKYRTLGELNEVLDNKTVLVADDDVRNIFSLTKALENYKMNVITAMDGKEALRQLEANPNIDLVLMDMMMPEMDGYQTTRAIRKNSHWKQLPVIAVTAKAMTGDREKCIQAGASDYITKPVDVDQLLSLLRVWLYDKR